MTAPLAPDLGRLADPARATPYDDVRQALLDALVSAKGAGHLEQGVWQEAFDGAVRSLRMRVLGDAEAVMRSAAAHSRFPSKRLSALLPDAEVADALLQRLLAEGMALERLEGMPDDPASRRARALAVTAGWEGAERVASVDAARWRALADEIAEWRRPTRPFWIAAAVLLAAGLVVAGWLGGQLPAPAWFAPVSRAFWSLPWP
ncbi:MAG: hypothetical protein ABIZ70_12485 [Gemmatimonadales bacterium]